MTYDMVGMLVIGAYLIVREICDAFVASKKISKDK